MSQRRMPGNVVTAVVAAWVLFAPAAHAQEPPPAPPAQTPPHAPPPPRFTGTLTAGMSLEAGRTDLTGVQVVFQARRPYSTGGAFTMGANYQHATTKVPGHADRVTVADHLDGSVGIEHNYGERWVLMARLQALRDPIKRLDYRVEQITGFGVRFGTPRVQVRVVPGIALLVHDKNVPDENGFNANYGIYQDLRVAVAPGWTFMQFVSASRDFTQDDDYFLTVDAKLTGAITRRFGLQLSYHYQHESLLPPGVEVWYQKTMAGLQFSF